MTTGEGDREALAEAFIKTFIIHLGEADLPVIHDLIADVLVGGFRRAGAGETTAGTIAGHVMACHTRRGSPDWTCTCSGGTGETTDLDREKAKAAYFAMWQFFLRLPGPSPLSDVVQREAMRLRALIPDWQEVPADE